MCRRFYFLYQEVAFIYICNWLKECISVQINDGWNSRVQRSNAFLFRRDIFVLKIVILWNISLSSMCFHGWPLWVICPSLLIVEFGTKMELEVTIQEAMAANLGSWINYAYIVEKRPSTGTCPCTLSVPPRYVYFIQQPRFASMSSVFLLLMVYNSLLS